MSVDSILGGVQSISSTITGGVNVVLRTGGDLGLPTLGGAAPSWFNQLRPASFRGVPFHVLEGESAFGRRSVVHQYPYRDTPWVEDMGRGARLINVTGFIVGDDAIQQREQLIIAAEAKSDTALLVHPTFGELQVSLIGPLRIREAWDQGRMFEIHFSFMEAGEQLFPNLANLNRVDLDNAADGVNAAATEDFTKQAAAALKKGAAVVRQAAASAAYWGRRIQAVSNDATNLMHVVSTLSGQVGRFAQGRNVAGIAIGVATAGIGAGKTTAELIALGAKAREAAKGAIARMTNSADELSGS